MTWASFYNYKWVTLDMFCEIYVDQDDEDKQWCVMGRLKGTDDSWVLSDFYFTESEAVAIMEYEMNRLK